MKVGIESVIGFGLGVALTCAVVIPLQQSEDKKVADVEDVAAKPLKNQRRAAIKSKGPSADVMDLKDSLIETYSSKHEKLLTGLSAVKLHELVKVIEGEANFIDGLDYRAESALGAILNELAKQDIDGMASWLKSQYEPELSDKILEDWFRGQKQMDKRTAFELAKAYIGEKALSGLAGNFMLYGNKDGVTTEDTLYYLDYVPVSGGSSGSDIKFSEDFDFRAFADKSLQRIEEDKENGSSLSSYPTNFYKEWVKHDSEGAFAFFEEKVFERDVELPFNDYSDLIEGYIDSAPPAETAFWLTEVLNGGGLQKEEYKQVIQKLYDQKLGGIGYTHELLEYTTDPDRLMAEIAAETFHQVGWDQKFAKSLKSFDSFEHFLKGAESAISNHSPMYEHHSYMVKIMENLKRPQPEIDRVKALFKQADEERREERFKKRRESRS